MKIGLGSLSCQRHPGDPRTVGEVYRDALTLAEEAERLGFDSIWCSEHHFFDAPELRETMAQAGVDPSSVQVQFLDEAAGGAL